MRKLIFLLILLVSSPPRPHITPTQSRGTTSFATCT